MTVAIRRGEHRAVRLAAAGGLLIIVVGLAALWEQSRITAVFVQSLHLPGTPQPAASAVDGLPGAIAAVAALAALIAALLLVRGGRRVLAMAAVVSAFAAIMTVEVVATSELMGVSIGQVVVTPVAAAVAVVGGASVAIGAAVLGWLTTPSEVSTEIRYMPPPTHQG